MQKLIFYSCCSLFMSQGFSQTLDSNRKQAIGSKQHLKDSLQSPGKTELNVFPNPARNKVTLQVKGFEPGMALIKILDTKGKLVRQENRLLTSGDEDIIMFLMLPPGIYFLLVSEKGKISRKKLVMQ